MGAAIAVWIVVQGSGHIFRMDVQEPRHDQFYRS
jgi:hypothetical protein